MTEKYQLSQDFQEKQLQLLERKYGGPNKAAKAALTIQRAFRRYSMGKKFADLTAHAKKEQRFSRRLEGGSAGSVSPSAKRPTGSDRGGVATCGHHSQRRAAANGTSVYTSPSLASSARHRCHVHHHHHYHHHSGRHHHCGFAASPSAIAATPPLLPSASTESATAEDCDPRCVAGASAATPALPHPSSTSSLDTDSTDAAGGAESSCPDIQSFPLDETSVYSYPLRQGQGGSSRSSSSHRGSVKSNGSGGNSHNLASDGTDGSTPRSSKKSHHSKSAGALASSSPAAAGPSVPKRAAAGHQLESRKNNGLSPSPLASHQSSPGSSSYGQMHHFHQHRHATPPSAAGQRQRPQQQPHSFGDGGEVRLRHPQQQQSHLQMQSSPALLHVQPSHPAYHRGSPASVGGEAYSAGEVLRKRHYRTGLNIFNKRPEKGIAYLIRRGFLENSPQAVARFLITRKGLSKQMIGEYLGNLAHPFNSAVLGCFSLEMDFAGMQLDTALRKFQTYFRMPGEAQKIERLMEVFSGRFCQCNADAVAKFHSTDTVFILAFAIILLNTDLHTPSLKQEKRMKVEDFIRNLRGIDDGHDVDADLLMGIYDRVRNQEFKPGGDHVTQVIKVQQTIVAKCPNLAVPHRRLVCYCRLYEVPDPHKRERPGVHQREVFLFNDILVITKIHSRKKSSVTYAFRQSHLLAGLAVTLFETQFYPFGIQIADKYLGKVVLRLNARNEHDRSKFVEDLRESVAEMDEMEALRLEAELEKQRASITSVPSSPGALASVANSASGGGGDGGNKTTGAASSSSISNGDARKGHHAGSKHSNGGPVMRKQPESNGGVVLRRSAINNSLLDLSEATAAEKVARRGSVGSLDSGMSISFQSTSVGSFQQQQQQQLQAAAAAAESKSAAAASSSRGGVRHH